jgi:hypothetical protein
MQPRALERRRRNAAGATARGGGLYYLAFYTQ